MQDSTKIAVFKGKEIRKIIYKNEWWFSVIDVVAILTDSDIPRRYWSDLKIKLKKEGFIEVYEKIVQLKLKAFDGKLRETDCANTESIFRIIQTIPSPKAEPLQAQFCGFTFSRVISKNSNLVFAKVGGAPLFAPPSILSARPSASL